MTSCSDKKEDIKTGEFPIPYPEGGEVITDKWDGKSGHRTVKYTADRHSELIDFYDDYTSGSGWKRSEAGSGFIPSAIYLNLTKGYTIDVGSPEDQVSEAVLITLYVAD
ncbi:hypothetical protein [Albibacterium profundi]|uniref:Uncharacterized protein n=1 Tax=Albibacterium profundi TaxID=3134906 RepID=A0ABV5CED5_9SPHI